MSFNEIEGKNENDRIVTPDSALIQLEIQTLRSRLDTGMLDINKVQRWLEIRVSLYVFPFFIDNISIRNCRNLIEVIYLVINITLKLTLYCSNMERLFVLYKRSQVSDFEIKPV